VLLAVDTGNGEVVNLLAGTCACCPPPTKPSPPPPLCWVIHAGRVLPRPRPRPIAGVLGLLRVAVVVVMVAFVRGTNVLLNDDVVVEDGKCGKGPKGLSMV
jgi:hypothetical protein